MRCGALIDQPSNLLPACSRRLPKKGKSKKKSVSNLVFFMWFVSRVCGLLCGCLETWLFSCRMVFMRMIHWNKSLRFLWLEHSTFRCQKTECVDYTRCLLQSDALPDELKSRVVNAFIRVVSISKCSDGGASGPSPLGEQRTKINNKSCNFAFIYIKSHPCVRCRRRGVEIEKKKHSEQRPLSSSTSL